MDIWVLEFNCGLQLQIIFKNKNVNVNVVYLKHLNIYRSHEQTQQYLGFGKILKLWSFEKFVSLHKLFSSVI